MKQWSVASAMIGACVLVALWTLELFPSLAVEPLVLVGPLIAVPLGLYVIRPRREDAPKRALHFSLVVAQLPAALAAMFSTMFEPGVFAGVLAGIWLVFTLGVALHGFLSLYRRGIWPLSESSIDVGCIYLAVGGAWFFASRIAFRPLEFSDLIVVLTAAHFHFAGFCAALLVGLAGRAVSGGLRRVANTAVLAIVGGTALVAAGITASPLLEWLGAWVMVLGFVAYACVVLFKVVWTRSRKVVALLLVLSCVANLVAMGFAALYGWSEWRGEYLVTIPTMLRWHAPLNIFGFSLLGLLAWLIDGGDGKEGLAP